MKKTIFTGLGLLAILPFSQAQVSQTQTLYTKLTLGVHGCGTILSGDVPVSRKAPAGKLSLEYNFNPFISVGIEAQAGLLKEGDNPGTANSKSELYDKSSFGGGNINGRLALGQFMGGASTGLRNTLGRIYVAAGVGFVHAHAIDVQRGTGNLGGNNNSNLVTIPTNLGIDLPLIKREMGLPLMMLNLNYQFSFATNDNLDAFNYTSSYNNAKDSYSLFSVGVKFNLGKARLTGMEQKAE